MKKYFGNCNIKGQFLTTHKYLGQQNPKCYSKIEVFFSLLKSLQSAAIILNLTLVLKLAITSFVPKDRKC